METQDKKPAPPYLSFTTLNNFIDGLAVHMPTRIDKSLMRSMSGASQAALVAALDYLGLREAEKPTATLEQLASQTGAGRGPLWKNVIIARYPFLFDQGFDLRRATQAQLDERFRAEGISGETIRKCVAFFMAAAQASELEVSPYLRSVKSRAPRSTGGRASSSRRRPKREEKPLEQKPPADVNPAAQVVASATFEGGVTVELRVTGNAFALSSDDRAKVFGWIDAMKKPEKPKGEASGSIPQDPAQK